MGRKLGVLLCSLFGEGSWVPIYHNVAVFEAYLPMPSFVLIYPTVWPQYTNVTERQTDRTDIGQDRQDKVR